jgi:hypothetical protein
MEPQGKARPALLHQAGFSSCVGRGRRQGRRYRRVAIHALTGRRREGYEGRR